MDHFPFDVHICQGKLIPKPNIDFFVKLVGKNFANSGGTKDLMKYIIMKSNFSSHEKVNNIHFLQKSGRGFFM